MAQAKGVQQLSVVSALRYLVVSTRPRQWIKNIIIYLALFFTIDQRWDPQEVSQMASLLGKVTLGFIIFCMLSGAIYLLNDLVDKDRDQFHWRKKARPLASGRLAPWVALIAGIILAYASLIFSFFLSPGFGMVSILYLALMLAYSLVLKTIVILDVLTISAGFVLRAAAGAVVIGAPISPWLYMTTSLGALFLAFSKRRNELAIGGEGSGVHRETLKSYTIGLLDQFIPLVGAATLVAYIFYTFTADTLPNNHAMMLTIPFVMFGIFRYLYLMHQHNLGESPEEVLFTDLPMLSNICLWLVTATTILLVFR
jgi:4-hydroxybenzoate polyprenyltransferase